MAENRPFQTVVVNQRVVREGFMFNSEESGGAPDQSSGLPKITFLECLTEQALEQQQQALVQQQKEVVDVTGDDAGVCCAIL